MNEGRWTILPAVIGMMVLGNPVVPDRTHADQDWYGRIYLETSTVSPSHNCPDNLAFLRPQMDEVLRHVNASSFKAAMDEVLQASIPEAIAHADGLTGQISSLKQEIARLEANRHHAEKVARESSNNPDQPLVPCPAGKESGYCYAVEEYYVATASKLANRAFLEALECYQREGFR